MDGSVFLISKTIVLWPSKWREGGGRGKRVAKFETGSAAARRHFKVSRLHFPRFAPLSVCASFSSSQGSENGIQCTTVTRFVLSVILAETDIFGTERLSLEQKRQQWRIFQWWAFKKKRNWPPIRWSFSNFYCVGGHLNGHFLCFFKCSPLKYPPQKVPVCLSSYSCKFAAKILVCHTLSVYDLCLQWLLCCTLVAT